MIFLPYLNLSVINIICKDNSLLVLAQQNHRVGSFFPNTAVTLRINRVIESRINQNHYLLYSFSPFYCSKRMFYLLKIQVLWGLYGALIMFLNTVCYVQFFSNSNFSYVHSMTSMTLNYCNFLP